MTHRIENALSGMRPETARRIRELAMRDEHLSAMLAQIEAGENPNEAFGQALIALSEALEQANDELLGMWIE